MFVHWFIIQRKYLQGIAFHMFVCQKTLSKE